MDEPEYIGTARVAPALRPPLDGIARLAATAPHKLGLIQTERAFQADFLRLAKLHGWHRAHFRPGRVTRKGVEKYETPVGADGRGWPDVVLVRERVVFVELKSEAGTLRPEQAAWRDWLVAAGAEWYCFKPSDWAEIERTLAKVTR